MTTLLDVSAQQHHNACPNTVTEDAEETWQAKCSFHTLSAQASVRSCLSRMNAH